MAALNARLCQTKSLYRYCSIVPMIIFPKTSGRERIECGSAMNTEECAVKDFITRVCS